MFYISHFISHISVIEMDFQTIIVSIILLLAGIYVGKIFLRRTKSFDVKGDCGNDCGCDTKAKPL